MTLTHVRESKTVLDFGFKVLDSRFWIILRFCETAHLLLP